jgi:serine/threonine protein kinase
MQTILDAEESKYIILQKIGYGGTCTVFKGYAIGDSTHKLYAIKIFKEQHKKYFEKEIQINKSLPPKHFLSLIKYGSGYICQENDSKEQNNINKLLEKYNRNKIFYKIEEIAENGDLFNYVYELGKGFPEKISAKIFINILKNVKILHENNIIHGDIKPENILIGNDYSLKIIDFGFSQKLINNNNTIYNTEGSETYSPPEVKKASFTGYDGIKSDIFSLGVLLFVITVGRFPFKTSSFSDKKYRLIMSKRYEHYWKNFDKFNLSKEFKDLINHLLCFDPNQRLRIDEILNHPWIKNNAIFNINDDEFYIDSDIINELKKRRDIMKKKTN